VSIEVRRLVPALLLAPLLVLPAGGATASCAGPQLTVPEGPLSSGTVAEGRFFVDGCNDQGGGSVLGCTTEEPEVETPMEDVELVLVQGGQEWVLGVEDADTAEEGRLGQLSWQVALPPDVRPGRARLIADGARLRVRIAE